jgi:hypothetical protein
MEPVGRQSGPDVGPTLPLALRQVCYCCWNSADAGCKVFCFQACGAHAVCTGENFHVQLPGPFRACGITGVPSLSDMFR